MPTLLQKLTLSARTVLALVLISMLPVGACSPSPDRIGAVVVAPSAKPMPAQGAVRNYVPPSVGPMQLWNASKAAATKLLQSGSTP